MIQLATVFQSLRRHFIPFSAPPAAAVYPALHEPAVPPAVVATMRISAVDILRNEPDLSAAELAGRAGVTLSYASMLVRRRKPRRLAVAAVRHFDAQPPVVEAHAREQIQQAAAAGRSTEQIANQLRISPGEVEFALKIARLTKKT
jgi:hypothetical protein